MRSICATQFWRRRPCGFDGSNGNGDSGVSQTWVAGVPELIENRVSGLLVPPSDVNQLANVIQELINHPSEAFWARKSRTSTNSRKI